MHLFENNFKVLNYPVILNTSFIENYKCKVIETLITEKEKKKIGVGVKEGNEKWFYFSINMSLLIKERYEISLYATTEDDIKVSCW